MAGFNAADMRGEQRGICDEADMRGNSVHSR